MSRVPTRPVAVIEAFTIDARKGAARARDGAVRPLERVALPALGMVFGLTLVLGGAASWWRIQEMFRFHSTELYLVFASAVVTAALGIWLLRPSGSRTCTGEPVTVAPKVIGRGAVRYWAGGTIFGLGWSLSGACPGPIGAMLGAGVWTMGVVLLAALAGTYGYAVVRGRLPH